MFITQKHYVSKLSLDCLTMHAYKVSEISSIRITVEAQRQIIHLPTAVYFYLSHRMNLPARPNAVSQPGWVEFLCADYQGLSSVVQRKNNPCLLRLYAK